FRSAAEARRDMVAGIVLSGWGTDGTLGLKTIKERGGLTVAQKPETAKHDGMPRSAVESGVVDYVLPVEEIPVTIVDYFKHGTVLKKRLDREITAHETIRNLADIFPLLRKRTGHDFSHYKESTLVRRVQRRMQLLHVPS